MSVVPASAPPGSLTKAPVELDAPPGSFRAEPSVPATSVAVVGLTSVPFRPCPEASVTTPVAGASSNV